MNKLITIRQSKHSKGKLQTADFKMDDDMGEDSVCSFATAILNPLTMTSSQKLPLCVAWTTEDAQFLFHQFPHCFRTNTMNGTNQEKQPLAWATAMTWNNSNTPFWNAFLPLGSRWVHRWIFQEAFPHLFPPALLSKCSLVVTDEDPLCCKELESAMKAGIFLSAKHRLCKWHQVSCNFVLPVRTHMRKACKVHSGFVKLISEWLYSFTNSIKTETEEQFHVEELQRRRRHCPNVSEVLKSFAMEFVCKSFVPSLHHLCHCHCMHLPNGNVLSNSFSESKNSAMKRNDTGPHPQQSIDLAQEAIQSHEMGCLLSTLREASHGLSKTLSQRPAKKRPNQKRALLSESEEQL